MTILTGKFRFSRPAFLFTCSSLPGVSAKFCISNGQVILPTASVRVLLDVKLVKGEGELTHILGVCPDDSVSTVHTILVRKGIVVAGDVTEAIIQTEVAYPGTISF